MTLAWTIKTMFEGRLAEARRLHAVKLSTKVS